MIVLFPNYLVIFWHRWV